MSSKSQECEAEVRVKCQRLKCRQGNQEYWVKKDNRNIQESVKENEK